MGAFDENHGKTQSRMQYVLFDEHNVLNNFQSCNLRFADDVYILRDTLISLFLQSSAYIKKMMYYPIHKSCVNLYTHPNMRSLDGELDRHKLLFYTCYAQIKHNLYHIIPSSYTAYITSKGLTHNLCTGYNIHNCCYINMIYSFTHENYA